jgi:hypothetical protein
MLEARIINIHSDGLLEVVGLESRLDLTEVWIVNIPTDQLMDWKVLYKQALAGAELAPSLPPSPLSSTPLPILPDRPVEWNASQGTNLVTLKHPRLLILTHKYFQLLCGNFLTSNM